MGDVEKGVGCRAKGLGLRDKTWMAVRGLSVRTAEPRQAMTIAVMLTVSWNCRNLQMLSYTHLP